ncbi:protein Ecm18p [Monosporozyma unispora]|nr:hypothetical protein C6P44_002645 [Kazachstania unispora]
MITKTTGYVSAHLQIQPLIRFRHKRFMASYEAAPPIKTSTLQAKIFKKAWNTSEEFKRSTLKMWSTHLRGVEFTKAQLELYQKKLMSNIEIGGSMDNIITAHGINQWHFHNDNVLKIDIKTPVLLIHGYASSSMSFFRNVSHLSQHCKDLFAIDLPSNGLSERSSLKVTPFDVSIFGQSEDINNCTQLKITRLPDDEKVQRCIEEHEDYYLEAIEQWRLDNAIDKFHLVGHSFGGYLSYKYALKYPHAVNKLCLISPLGMERNLLSMSSNHWKLGEIIDKDFHDPMSDRYCRKLNIPKYVFENQLKILRWGGPMGARLCWNYITSAYSRVPSLDFKEYMFELFYGKGGISPIARTIFVNLFTRNLLARAPIMDTLDQLKVEDMLLCYGQHDWMNRRAGQLAVQTLNKGNYTPARYLQIPQAGHNLFLDNPDCFNVALTSFLKD